ncbi:hypothetical protein J2TS6_48250 [Paenibacillus albilobatus]|uniref:Uncharacterized protein n=1 Tax=Paenibacillus albilobatus TaxID=2716884 RepID=A0A920CE92_9BACL|nr:hypothetical protein [Paenibacillus albilobatus]GIO33684.1 hypothetical protein J2TS6_48250 [Paenibacillus albilobatus]
MDKEIAAARQALQHVPIMEGSIIGGALGKLDRALKEKDAEIESLKQQFNQQTTTAVEWMVEYYTLDGRFQEQKRELAAARREIERLGGGKHGL